MSRPNYTQAGAFFGVLASALILVLTAMAFVTVGAGGPIPHRGYAVEQAQAVTTQANSN